MTRLFSYRYTCPSISARLFQMANMLFVRHWVFRKGCISANAQVLPSSYLSIEQCRYMSTDGDKYIGNSEWPIWKQLQAHVDSGTYRPVVEFVNHTLAQRLQEVRVPSNNMNALSDTKSDSSHMDMSSMFDDKSLCAIIEACASFQSTKEVIQLVSSLRAVGQSFPQRASAVYLEALVRRYARFSHNARVCSPTNNSVMRDEINPSHNTQTPMDASLSQVTEAGMICSSHRPAASSISPLLKQPPLQIPNQPTISLHATATSADVMSAAELFGHLHQFRRIVSNQITRAWVDEIGRRLKRAASPEITRDLLHLLISDLLKRRLRPSRAVLHTYILAVRMAGDANDIELALDIARNAQYTLNCRQYTLLIQLASIRRRAALVEELFSDMEQNNVRPKAWTWSERMRCYALNGDVAMVEGLIQKMKERKLPLLPSVFHRFLEAHAFGGDLPGAEQVYAVFEKTGYSVHPSLLLPLLRAYLEAKRAQSSLSVLIRMHKHGLAVRESDMRYVVELFMQDGNMAGALRAESFWHMFRNNLDK